MIKENKIKKYVVVIICLLGMLILSGKTENVFANDKKSKDMENSLLSFYIKDVSNVESIRYIPLDKKIIGNKRITDKSNVVDIGFGEYYIKVKDENVKETESISGKITKIVQGVVDGNSHYYMMLEKSDEIFDISVIDYIDVIKYNVGDEITLEYQEGKQTNTVINIK